MTLRFTLPRSESATNVEDITDTFLGTEKRATNRSSMAYMVYSTTLNTRAYCVASDQSLRMREALFLRSGTSPGTPKIRMPVLALSNIIIEVSHC
jgi:V8-like Glu-specific endopeptidase